MTRLWLAGVLDNERLFQKNVIDYIEVFMCLLPSNTHFSNQMATWNFSLQICVCGEVLFLLGLPSSGRFYMVQACNHQDKECPEFYTSSF